MENIELKILEEIRAAFPRFSEEEGEAALLLLKARAKALDRTLEKYMAKFHPAGLAERDESLPDRYRGYVEFLAGDARAIIRAGKGADFLTFAHESAHIFRRQLSGNLLKRANRAFGVQGGAWTTAQEELFARGFEEFIRTRREEDAERKHVYTKGAEFVQNVYKGLDHIVSITPEMRSVYEELFKVNRIKINGRDEVFNQEKFDERLREIYEGDVKGSYVFMGVTPPIYERLGFERLPLIITRKHLYTAMRDDGMYSERWDNYHGLGEELVRQIPERLKRPAFIVRDAKRPGQIISVVELVDKNNNPIILPIAQNLKIEFRGAEVEINLAKSIFGRQGDFKRWIKAARDNDLILYEDKRRSPTLLRSGASVRRSRTSSLATDTPIDAPQAVSGFYVNNIARYKEIVKGIYPELSKKYEGDILFQSGATQGAFDFGDGDGRAALAVRRRSRKRAAGKKRAVEQGRFDFGGGERSENKSDKKRDGEIRERRPAAAGFERGETSRFIERYLALAGGEYQADPVGGAREALRAVAAWERRVILEELRGRGCVDAETTRRYLLSLLPEREERSEEGRESARERDGALAATKLEVYRARAGLFDGEPDFAKGYSYETGFDGKRYTINVRDENGKEVGAGFDRSAERVKRWIEERGGQVVIEEIAKRAEERAALEFLSETLNESGLQNIEGEAEETGDGAGVYGLNLRSMDGGDKDSYFTEIRADATGGEIRIFIAATDEDEPEELYEKRFEGAFTEAMGAGVFGDMGAVLRAAVERRQGERNLDEDSPARSGGETLITADRLDMEIGERVSEQERSEETIKGVEDANTASAGGDEGAFDKDAAESQAGGSGEDVEAPPGEFRAYGAWTDYERRLTAGERARLNAAALAVLEKPDGGITELDKGVLRRYSGHGGIEADEEKGVFYEYYTSPPIADMT